jgi:threonine dehydratase
VPSEPSQVDPAAIEAAARRIDGAAVRTPLQLDDHLRATGADVWLGVRGRVPVPSTVPRQQRDLMRALGDGLVAP